MPISGSAPSKSYQRQVGAYTGSDAFAQVQAAGRKVLSADQDFAGNDIADAINDCLFLDGGNFAAPMDINGQKFQDVGDATARTEFAAAGQIQDGELIYAATSSNDTITASLSPAITAYATGMLMVAKAGGTNTGAATINVNSVGAKSIKKGKAGSLDVSAGDMAAGRMLLLGYDGTNMQLLNAPEFPSSTKMIFWQTSAPTGWTKDTNHNDKALRITSGTASTGGTVAFETAFASKTPTGTVGATTLTVNQIPLHGHSARYSQTSSSSADGAGGIMLDNDGSQTTNTNTGAAGSTIGNQIGGTGGGESHTHTWTGDAINLDVAFVDCILATKD